MTGLDAAFAAAGAAAWGGTAYSHLLSCMSPQARAKAEECCPHPAMVLAAAFPYYAGDRPGNLSLYARGADYHSAVIKRLNPVCDFLRENYPFDTFFPAADNSPLPEREAAWLAGLGLRGKHGLFILPPYGTYVFLGTILTSAALPLAEAAPAPDCVGCGRCIAACPSGALNADRFQPDCCLSHLTQKKGGLSPAEAALVAEHPYVWGCDLCQRACPYNAGPECSPLPEFREDLIDSLAEGDLEGMTNRTFREKYGGRAFAWRGPSVLRRNLGLQKKDV